MKLAILTVAATLVSAPLLAQPAQPVSGTFSSKDVKFDVEGAVAFAGPSGLDKADTVLLVAVSNAGLNADALAAFVDRKRAAEKLIKSVKITKGWATADKASLLIEGEGEAGKLVGEVLLVNVKGAWVVDEELVDLVL